MAGAPQPTTRRRVGIEKIHAYPCALAIDLETLGAARGREPGYAWNTVRGRARSVNPPWEDPVTMAVNAARAMLTEDDIRAIELLIVGTESSPDQGKPISTFVFRHLGLGSHCRNFEVKHACYGGTSALMMAAHWVASGVAPGKKALVICADESRMNLNVRWEFVMGAGSVALLVSDRPDVLELELEGNGYWTDEVGDTFRPTSKDEAGNTDESLYTYLEALAGAYQHFHEKSGLDYVGDFAGHVYHMPFSGMARRSHRTVLRMSGANVDADASFEARVEPGTRYASLVGGTYTASTFFALMSLVDHSPSLASGDRISIFSYGSGCCSEFYSGIVGPRAREVVDAARLQERIDARHPLTVEEYETVERARASAVDRGDWRPDLETCGGLYGERYVNRGLLVYRGIEGFFRDYGWS